MPDGCRSIVRAGAGYNTIDVAAASKRGIYVSNCPGKNAIAVAELRFALILALDRRVPDNVAELRAGKWNKKEYSKAQRPLRQDAGPARHRQHRTGDDSPGGRLRELNVVLWSRRFAGEPAADRTGSTRARGRGGAANRDRTSSPTPADVAARADILSVHLALGPETKGLVNAEIAQAAEARARSSSTPRAAKWWITPRWRPRSAIEGLRVGLDVFANEPASATGEFSDERRVSAGVYGTHHIGASTDQAQEAIAAETVRIIRSTRKPGACRMS